MIPPLLWALTVHEFAHGWMAHKCGDDTALLSGRLTLNPLAHLDPLGTIAMFLVHFGWAKPVPVNPYNYRNPKRDDILVSVAGVSANFLSAITFALGYHLILKIFGGIALSETAITLITGLLDMLRVGVFLNFVLIFFNLIPIPPLDGSHVLEQLLPWEMKEQYRQFIRPNGFIILLVLLFILPMAGINVIGTVVGGPTRFLLNVLQIPSPF